MIRIEDGFDKPACYVFRYVYAPDYYAMVRFLCNGVFDWDSTPWAEEATRFTKEAAEMISSYSDDGDWDEVEIVYRPDFIPEQRPLLRLKEAS